MLVAFIIAVFALSIFEIWTLVKQDKTKEILVFLGLEVLTLVVGSIYISNPYRESLSSLILNFLGFKE